MDRILGTGEGHNNKIWVLLDYVDVVVHVFNHENREFYALESLWGDAKITSYDEVTQSEV